MSVVGTFARWLSLPLEAVASEEPADAAVVLGAPLKPDGSLTAIVDERVRAGVDLWRRGLAPVVCFSGGTGARGRSPVPEAAAMADAALALGLPRAALRTEPTSLNTRENALHTAALLLPEGRRRVWVVTQPFHLRRALFWFRRAGLTPLGHHITNSLQYTDPLRGLKWVAREYASWLRLAAWELLGRS